MKTRKGRIVGIALFGLLSGALVVASIPRTHAGLHEPVQKGAYWQAVCAKHFGGWYGAKRSSYGDARKDAQSHDNHRHNGKRTASVVKRGGLVVQSQDTASVYRSRFQKVVTVKPGKPFVLVMESCRKIRVDGPKRSGRSTHLEVYKIYGDGSERLIHSQTLGQGDRYKRVKNFGTVRVEVSVHPHTTRTCHFYVHIERH